MATRLGSKAFDRAGYETVYQATDEGTRLNGGVYLNSYKKRFTLIGTACLVSVALLGQTTVIPHIIAPDVRGESARPTTVIQASLSNSGLTQYTLHAVAFANAERGWVVGNGVILGTTNGGSRFVAQYRGSLDLFGVQAQSAQDVVAYGLRELLKTSDGGRTWTSLRMPYGPIIQMDFTSRTTGFAIGGNGDNFVGNLYVTKDGGNVWRQVPGLRQVTALAFANARVGWASTYHWVYRTENGGSTWTRVTRTPSHGIVRRMDATSTHHVWMLSIGGSGMSQTSYSVLASVDGVHFKPVLGVSTAGAGPAPGDASHVAQGPGSSPGPFVAVSDRVAYMAGECVACGAGITMFARTFDGGRTWTEYPPIPDLPGLPNSSGSGSAAAFPTASDGWLIGDMVGVSHQLYHTTDGGRHWSQAYPKITPANGFSFVNRAVGFGLGVPGHANDVVKTTDGGAVWQVIGRLPVTAAPQFNGGSAAPWAIHFVSARRGFAVGSDALLYGTVDGGRIWRRIPLPIRHSAYMYSSIWFANARAGTFVVNGYNNVPRRFLTTNGGQTWRMAAPANLQVAQTDLLPPTLARAASIQVKKTNSQNGVGTAGPQIAWVTTLDGFALTTNGGNTWKTVKFPQNVANQPETIQFTSSRDGYVQFLDGSLYRTIDGGRKWMLVAD